MKISLFFASLVSVFAATSCVRYPMDDVNAPLWSWAKPEVHWTAMMSEAPDSELEGAAAVSSSGTAGSGVLHHHYSARGTYVRGYYRKNGTYVHGYYR